MRRLGYLAFVLFFAVAGAPGFTMSSMAATSQTEHDAKPPIAEEEVRIEHAVPEAHRCRLTKPLVQGTHALVSSHTPQTGGRIPTRLDLTPRRALEKQNGIGAFLLC